jgi:tRNA 2-thiouridine synthesizing protein C
MRKRFLFVLRQAPVGGFQASEFLDMVMTAAAFDQAVSLLFLDDGVLQLLRGQGPDALGRGSVAAIFPALDLYDVEALWVERESLVERGVGEDAMVVPVKLIARASVADLLRDQTIVVSG